MLTPRSVTPDGLGFWEGIVHNLTEAGTFRLVLQPLMAIALGIRLGIGDAKAGRGPFLFRLVKERHHHWGLFKQSLRDAALPLTVALIVDGILQMITLGYVRPMAAVVVGTILVWIPFTASRALMNRAWNRFKPQRLSHET